MYHSDDYNYQSNGQFSVISNQPSGPKNVIRRNYGNQGDPRTPGRFNRPQHQFSDSDAYIEPQDQYNEYSLPHDQYGGGDVYSRSEDRFGGRDSFSEFRNPDSFNTFGGQDSFTESSNQFETVDTFSSPRRQFRPQNQYGRSETFFKPPEEQGGLVGGFGRPQSHSQTSGNIARPYGQNRVQGGFSSPQGQTRQYSGFPRPPGPKRVESGYSNPPPQNQARLPDGYSKPRQSQAPGPQFRPQGQNRFNPYGRPANQSKRPNNNADRPQWNSQNRSSVQQSGPGPITFGFGRSMGGNQERFIRAPPPQLEYTCSLCEVTCKTRFILDQHTKGKGHQKKVKRKEIEKLWAKKDPSAYCSTCELSLEPSVMEVHLNGEKHKATVERKAKETQESKDETENKDEESAEMKSDADQGEGKSESASTPGAVNIKCNLCSVTLTSLSKVSKHFNSKGHMLKCAAKCNEKKLAATTEAAAGATPESTEQAAEANPFHCSVCNITLTGKTPYDAHTNGYKHNYKLTKGKFEPTSPFFAKSMKRKEDMMKTKERQQKRKLMKKEKAGNEEKGDHEEKLADEEMPDNEGKPDNEEETGNIENGN